MMVGEDQVKQKKQKKTNKQTKSRIFLAAAILLVFIGKIVVWKLFFLVLHQMRLKRFILK